MEGIVQKVLTLLEVSPKSVQKFTRGEDGEGSRTLKKFPTHNFCFFLADLHELCSLKMWLKTY